MPILTYLVRVQILERFLAVRAHVYLTPLVDGNVLCQVGFLGEALTTSRLQTDEGTFAGVNSQVVKKVVPFSEYHATAFMCALQDLHLSVG